MALTAYERQILAGGAASAASEATGASYRPPGQSIRPYIQPQAGITPTFGGVDVTIGGQSLAKGSLGALVPAIGAAAGALGLSMPASLAAILGIAGAGYAGYQALGGGKGGGLFDNNLLGGDDFMMGGVEFGGPGLAEPLQPYSEWHIGNKQFYHMSRYTAAGKYAGAKVAMYNKDTGKCKVWSLPKPHLAIIGKNMPSHRMLTRLSRNMKRHTADAKTVLKITSPHSLAGRGGYHYSGIKHTAARHYGRGAGRR